MNDLFKTERSKKDQLREWILSRQWTKTHDVILWGLQNHHNRALRDAQQMAEARDFRRMTDEELGFYFPGSKEGVFVRNNFNETRRAA